MVKLLISAGTLPRKSPEYKELRESLISRSCNDQDQDDNEEKVCCAKDGDTEVDFRHFNSKYIYLCINGIKCTEVGIYLLFIGG